MSSLSYNPNIDIPPYHDNMMQSYSNNGMMQQPMQMMPMMQPHSNSGMMPMMQQPQMMPMIQQQPQMMTPQMMSSQMLTPQMYQNPLKNKKQKKTDQFTNVEEKSSNWGVYIKKLIIFTILFLVISHVKTNSIIEKIPMVGSNEIFMMVVKGFIMAIIIIIVDKILG